VSQVADGLWTPMQRRVLVAVVGLIVILGSIRVWRWSRFLADPVPTGAPRCAELSGRIDPNTAPWWVLAELPGIGEKTARAIIAYREAQGGAPFRRIEDLNHVRSLGPARLETIKPYLSFDENRNATSLPSEPD